MIIRRKCFYFEIFETITKVYLIETSQYLPYLWKLCQTFERKKYYCTAAWNTNEHFLLKDGSFYTLGILNGCVPYKVGLILSVISFCTFMMMLSLRAKSGEELLYMPENIILFLTVQIFLVRVATLLTILYSWVLHLTSCFTVVINHCSTFSQQTGRA